MTRRKLLLGSRIAILALFVVPFLPYGRRPISSPGCPEEPVLTSLTILTLSELHLGYIFQPYQAALTIGGGAHPYTLGLTSGQLPKGLALDATGKIRGRPTQAGHFSFTVHARDSSVPCPATITKTFSLSVVEIRLDQYGGLVGRPCPAGPRPHFYTAKLGARWFLCTPTGNAFWMLGVYHVDWPGGTDYQGVNPQQILQTKYGDTNITWGPQLNRRLKAWGFNATAEYSSIYVQPVSQSSGWPPPNPVPMPFTALVWPDYYSLTNSGNYASGPVKELVRATKTTVYTGYRAHSPDLWDPNFAQWIQGALANDPIIKSWYSGSNNDYFIGFNVDDLDLLQGFGAGPDYPTLANGVSSPSRVQPHLSWLILITPPTQTSNPEFGVTYTDTTVYSKQELSNWLSARYSSNIASLNAAWGSNYTTFASNGGWGTGTGLLDEDGTHSWVPTDYVNLNGATAGMKQDLDDFLFHHAQKYFSLVKAALQANAPSLLYLGPTTLGGWGAPPRRQVLQAASPYLDVLMVPSIPAGCSNCGANDDQGRIDFITQYVGDKPWISWEGFMAQPDSYMSPYAAPDTVRPQSSTQVNRGQLYQNMVNMLLNAKDTSTGTYHVAGLKWWEFYDNWGEQSNWGLVTRRDNAYDGLGARAAQGADSWGFLTGGEQRDYGNFLGIVGAANLGILRTLLASNP